MVGCFSAWGRAEPPPGACGGPINWDDTEDADGPAGTPETTAVRIYLLTCGHVQWGLDHGIDDWDRESVVCKGCGTHVGIRHYITEQAINL